MVYNHTRFKCSLCGREYNYHYHAVYVDTQSETLVMRCPVDGAIAFMEDLEAKLEALQKKLGDVREKIGVVRYDIETSESILLTDSKIKQLNKEMGELKLRVDSKKDSLNESLREHYGSDVYGVGVEKISADLAETRKKIEDEATTEEELPALEELASKLETAQKAFLEIELSEQEASTIEDEKAKKVNEVKSLLGDYSDETEAQLLARIAHNKEALKPLVEEEARLNEEYAKLQEEIYGPTIHGSIEVEEGDE